MSDLQDLMDAAVDRNVVPGIAAAVITPEGETIATAGTRGLDNPTPLTAETIFYIASCTKIITSVAALQLVESGAIGLDEPVGRYLDALAHPQVLVGFSADGTPELKPARTRITLRHLLTHTSGLAYDFTSAEQTRYVAAAGLDTRVPEPPPLPLMLEPGTGWIYGTGVDWAGRLIEAVSGEGLDTYFDKHILAPLGMNDTTFFPSAAQVARRASMHFRMPDGGLSVIEFGMPPTRHFWMGGAGLYSTITDYMKFLNAVAKGGQPLLGEAAFKQMRGSFGADLEAGWINTADPAVSFDYRPLADVRRGHGLLGVVNLDDVAGGRAAGSIHWGGATNCYFWVDPSSGVAGAVLAQLLPFGDRGVLEVFKDTEQIAYAL